MKVGAWRADFRSKEKAYFSGALTVFEVYMGPENLTLSCRTSDRLIEGGLKESLWLKPNSSNNKLRVMDISIMFISIIILTSPEGT